MRAEKVDDRTRQRAETIAQESKGLLLVYSVSVLRYLHLSFSILFYCYVNTVFSISGININTLLSNIDYANDED